MKRYGNIYQKICEIDNIIKAYNLAKKDKMFYEEVIMIEKNPMKYLLNIQSMLLNRTYKLRHDDYTIFQKEDKGKIRDIYKLSFYPHRIIQWAVILQIQDIFLKQFSYHSYASIPNKGIHLALRDLDKTLRNDEDNTRYCLKIDIKKFYPNINQEINKQQYRKIFKDKDLLWLIDMLIGAIEGNKGIPIGSLFSQWDGNYYLTPFDRWLKEDKKIKYVFRYCDDIVILHSDKNFLHQLRKDIQVYLKEKLDLELKENYQVFPVDVRGIDFVGYRHFRKYILLRKRTANNFKKEMLRILNKVESGKPLNYSEWCCINSYKGWIQYCNGYNLYSKYITPLLPYCEEFYKTKVKNKPQESR